MGYLRWYGDNMWLFIPDQNEIKPFLLTIEEYPYQEGFSLSASRINYRSLKVIKALQMFENMDKDFPIN